MEMDCALGMGMAVTSSNAQPQHSTGLFATVTQSQSQLVGAKRSFAGALMQSDSSNMGTHKRIFVPPLRRGNTLSNAAYVFMDSSNHSRSQQPSLLPPAAANIQSSMAPGPRQEGEKKSLFERLGTKTGALKRSATITIGK
jgi:hypothetical protein